jgi:hypothetical protein
VAGAPEDQLRKPIDDLVVALAELSGLPRGAVGLVGETTRRTLRHARTLPSRTVTRWSASSS